MAETVKNLPAVQETGDTVLTSGLRRSPGGGNGRLIQCSCLGTPTDRGAWWATVHRVTELDMTEHRHFDYF